MMSSEKHTRFTLTIITIYNKYYAFRATIKNKLIKYIANRHFTVLIYSKICGKAELICKRHKKSSKN